VNKTTLQRKNENMWLVDDGVCKTFLIVYIDHALKFKIGGYFERFSENTCSFEEVGLHNTLKQSTLDTYLQRLPNLTYKRT
jgi:hypothetical protein